MIRKAIPEDLDLLCGMPSSSADQNSYLRQSLVNGVISYADCYVLEKDKQLLARLVLIRQHLGLYTIEDISQKECSEFLKEALSQSTKKDLTTVLYEDKPHFEVIHQSLLDNNFDLRSKRDNFQHSDLKVQETMLDYYDLRQKDDSLMIEAMDMVEEGHLDTINIKGNFRGIDHYHDLKEQEYLPESWFLAYDNDILVGFVVIHSLSAEEMCINYIGVLPQYRGHHYSDDLVKKALSYAGNKGAKILSAETDINNFPMRNSLLRCGFQKTQGLNYYVQL